MNATYIYIYMFVCVSNFFARALEARGNRTMERMGIDGKEIMGGRGGSAWRIYIYIYIYIYICSFVVGRSYARMYIPSTASPMCMCMSIDCVAARDMLRRELDAEGRTVYANVTPPPPPNSSPA